MNENHDHESGRSEEGRGLDQAAATDPRRRSLEEIQCVWRGRKLTLGDAGIRALLRSPKCTPTCIAWATRWLAIKCVEFQSNEKFSPMGYVFALIKRGCDEPPTDQELAWKPVDRTRLPHSPPPVPAAELAAMREKAANMPPIERTIFFKQSNLPPFASPISAAMERTLREIPRMSDEDKRRIIAELEPAELEDLLAATLKRWPRDVIESWRRQDLQPLDVPSVLDAVAIAAMSREGGVAR